MRRLHSAVALALTCTAKQVLATAAAASDPGTLPRFKWGQTKEHVFITLAVRGLNRSSVGIAFRVDSFHFACTDEHGTAYSLDLTLVQDVDSAACHWQHLPRPDRWGEAVLATLAKTYPAPWSSLVQNPAPYRQMMDRDWAREDQALELEEPDLYFSEHQAYLRPLLQESLADALSGVDALVVNVRHSACQQCTAADANFAKVANQVSKAVAGSWEARIRLMVVDARAERLLARRVGAAGCANRPVDCRHFVVTDVGDSEAIRIRGRHEPGPLLRDLLSFAR
mmetsp:Transcript_35521/g.70241  ORF Transcript_35521/g.70241 Transcript_35521/m.70241 type:complete len:282 (-) Transcript_35521:11-856(-)